jgi:hypothetical protein
VEQAPTGVADERVHYQVTGGSGDGVGMGMGERGEGQNERAREHWPDEHDGGVGKRPGQAHTCCVNNPEEGKGVGGVI